MIAANAKETAFRSGYIAITGRPNVGKSTLLNSILGEKVSIVTSKPQTTQKRIMGVRTDKDSQIIFVDTPGIHMPVNSLGEYMNREAEDALKGVDAILFMVEPCSPGAGDRFIIRLLKQAAGGCPVILLINKSDTVKKDHLLPVMDEYSRLYDFDAIFPLSALNPKDVNALLDMAIKKLPHGPKYYAEDVLTDQYERYMAAEIIREKIMEATEEEVPHSAAVEVAEWTERKDGLLYISANIFVERHGQKGIIIGKAGGRLKMIGSAARADIERLVHAKVFLRLWVKVIKDWREDAGFLKRIGFK